MLEAPMKQGLFFLSSTPPVRIALSTKMLVGVSIKAGDEPVDSGVPSGKLT